MSHSGDPVQHSGDEDPTQGSVQQRIEPREKDLGGFSVRRLLPTAACRQVGPWVFFDHMGPAQFGPGPGINVRPHPHIHLATVTYLFEGEMLHRDSLGTEQVIYPGDVNLMVAGRGIVHSERERPAIIATERPFHGLQLWLALPESDEEMEPAFYHYPQEDLPQLEVQGVPLRVMMGSAYGVKSPVKTFAETLYIEAQLAKGHTLQLPAAPQRALYLVDGEGELDGDLLPAYSMAILANRPLTLQARTDLRIALIGGEPLGRRHMYWNFVSSKSERIEQAKEDWREGRFPKVPGDTEEFIPLPS